MSSLGSFLSVTKIAAGPGNGTITVFVSIMSTPTLPLFL